MFKDFKKTVWEYYKKERRLLPWREEITPYNIVISEVMLQQTQVPRILVKYPTFVQELPDFHSLATASLNTLLSLWQGIGYNRRALYLQKLANIIVKEYKGELPENPIILETLPGIGKATAASICVYAFNKPIPFIETNIRRIYIHHFFQDKDDIHDKEIYPLVEQTIDIKNPREWYYALMDYGTMLGKTVDNPNKRSKHYAVQSKFEGSDRQIRGSILKQLIQKPLQHEEIYTLVAKDAARIDNVLNQLVNEGFIIKDKDIYQIK